MQNLYIVKNITSGEVNDNDNFRLDSTINSETYTLLKKPLLSSEPTGEVVNHLTPEEFNANIDSLGFGGSNGSSFRKQELFFSEEIATQFSQAQSGLSSVNGNALFDALEKTSHRLSRGQVTLAHYEFNLITDPLITQSMKDFVNDLFVDYFDKVPRDLS